MTKVIVIGGGAAGLMAAFSAKAKGTEVILLEQNEKLGKKLYITGKGRCNVTNANCPENFFDNIVVNPKFMYSSFKGFDSNCVIDFFESRGCKLKTERGGRVFPVSDHSSDIIACLSNAIKGAGVKVRTGTRVTNVEIDKAAKAVKGVVTDKGEFLPGDNIIMATGGISYASTGSTGIGHRILKELGHNIIDLKPSLVPLEIKEDWYKDLQGLSLKNVSVRLTNPDVTGKKAEIYSGTGEMLFTHFGISGPLILSASSFLVKKEYNGAVLSLDLKPALTYEQLDKRIVRDFEANNNKMFKNSLGELLPSKLIPVIVRLSGIDENRTVNSIKGVEREGLVKLLKDWKMTVTNTRGFNEAIITRGGVSVKEINPKTMESRIIRGLFVCGELLDVDALTGGYNLQIAWSSGYAAGAGCVSGYDNANDI